MKQSNQERKTKAIKNNDHEFSQKGLILGHLRTIKPNLGVNDNFPLIRLYFNMKSLQCYNFLQRNGGKGTYFEKN